MRVRLEYVTHDLRIRTRFSADRTDLVSEGDFQSMERIARILDHFRGWNWNQIKRSGQKIVQVANRGSLGGIVSADNRKWRIEKIVDGSAFPQELWIETYEEITPRLLAAGHFNRRGNYIFCRARQHGTADHDPVECVFHPQGRTDIRTNFPYM